MVCRLYLSALSFASSQEAVLFDDLVLFFLPISTMNASHRNWNVLCWNVRGINDSRKWSLVRNKIDGSGANIFCLQETKRDDFDIRFIRNFAPKHFDKFELSPSVGASGVS